MTVSDLDERSRKLDKFRGALSKPRTGIRLDLLKNIITDLENNPEIKSMFGEAPTSKIAIISDMNDLKIVDAGLIELTDEQKNKFLEIMNDVFRRNVPEV